ncbi:MAG: sigma-70 family RNA polymerase sigma factor [Phycisphaerae bacterium]|nr:sigma-70 family RNA polymerase sigma factor [Phycisphaerae bacterium]
MSEDRTLVEQMRRGDTAALRRIYLKYRDDLHAVATYLLADASQAEDVLHEVFVGFASGANGFHLRSDLRAYLATCVANRARDRLRRRFMKDVPLDQGAPVPDPGPEPVQEAMMNERAGRLYAALSELPIEQREAITLHLHGGLAFRAIARDLGVSVYTVKSRYRYGLQKLRSVLLRLRGDL